MQRYVRTAQLRAAFGTAMARRHASHVSALGATACSACGSTRMRSSRGLTTRAGLLQVYSGTL
eukprot:358316-Chlamydomonas_euryale.AAC.8